MECIGCVQKRVGSRLRKLKNVSKGVKLSDGKGLGCKGKLHHLCPDGDDSWCGYKRDKKSYKHKNCIPKCIVEIIEPVSDDLSNPDLLQKCTHSMTQNVNECLDGLIWDRCPKTTYVEQETVSLATYLAVLKFNDGDISYLKISQDLNIKPGMFTSQGAGKCDQFRIRLSAKKAKETEKVKRKTLTLHKHHNLKFAYKNNF